MAKPKPGDPDYEHVKGQMDVYDVLAEIEKDPGEAVADALAEFYDSVRDVVQQRLKGEQDGQADQGK